MHRVTDMAAALERLAPLAYQESYDNAGLLVGDPQAPVTGVLVTLDVTEAVVEEAVARQCNLVVAHHPLIFKGLRRITTATAVERTVALAIRHGVALYAAHTNLDHVSAGVNRALANHLGLRDARVLAPRPQTLQKLVTFVPRADSARVLEALHAAGAGQVGQYADCSFRVEGTGTFRPGAMANPAIGQPGQTEEVAEHRLELILPAHRANGVLRALRQAHPYEEVAYYLSALDNADQDVGAGMVGTLPEPLAERDFLQLLKDRLNPSGVRHTALLGRPVRTVAVCGGAGKFLLAEAIRQGADAFVSADFKYHEFFEAEGRVLVADVGHYESEVLTKNLLTAYLSEKFPNLAVLLSDTPTNPVNYF